MTYKLSWITCFLLILIMSLASLPIVTSGFNCIISMELKPIVKNIFFEACGVKHNVTLYVKPYIFRGGKDIGLAFKVYTTIYIGRLHYILYDELGNVLSKSHFPIVNHRGSSEVSVNFFKHNKVILEINEIHQLEPTSYSCKTSIKFSLDIEHFRNYFIRLPSGYVISKFIFCRRKYF